MPTSKGEGRISENLKRTEKQAASAREVPEMNRFYSSLLQDQKRGKKPKYWKPFLLGGCVSVPLTYLYFKRYARRKEETPMLKKKV